MANLSLIETPLAGLMLVESRPVGDQRGSFARLYCARELEPLGLPGPVARVRLARAAVAGAVRGLSCQRPARPAATLARCLRGRVFHVAVDLRKGSPTFLQRHGVELTPENHLALCVPQGFAHGFQALAPDSEVLYVETEPDDPAGEIRLRPDDPALGIAWPVPLAGLSGLGATHSFLDQVRASLEIS